MTLAIRMPELAPGATGATLVKWLVGVGTRVEPGHVVAEVESDKAVVELEADSSGVVERIVVAEGTSDVAPDQVLAILTPVQPDAGESPRACNARLDAPAATATVGRDPSDVPQTSASARREPPPGGPGPTARPPPPDAPGPSGRPVGEINASALARHIARQAGLGARAVTGSGPGGRVLAQDVLVALDRDLSHEAPSAARRHTGTASIAEEPPEAHQQRADGAPPPLGAAVPAHALVPIDDTRRTLARRLSASKRDIPHLYMSRDCRADALLALEAVLNRDLAPERALSLDHLLVKIVAETLRRAPALNAGWTESGIRRFHRVDLSVAVATPHGSVAPVVRDAAGKSLMRIAHELDDLLSRARAGTLAPDELRGGTFTVSNLWRYGVRSFAAIIDPPQAATLAVGAADPAPVVVAGEVRGLPRMTLTLALDHRVADGVAGAEFLAELNRLLEDPRRLIL